jgi:hypothetical protein
MVLLLLLLVLFALGVAVLNGNFGERPRLILRGAMRPAAIVGGVGFVLGFVGPILVTPGANQGPMLGIFITGPLGFLIGLVWGLAAGWLRSRNQ